MAEIANEMGFKALVAKTARPTPMFDFEFDTMRLG